jgi:hypothetical protein
MNIMSALVKSQPRCLICKGIWDWFTTKNGLQTGLNLNVYPCIEAETTQYCIFDQTGGNNQEKELRVHFCFYITPLIPTIARLQVQRQLGSSHVIIDWVVALVFGGKALRKK